jgi:hypothetical protein
VTDQPDPVVLAHLYGNQALETTLRALYARREHLNLLIALIQAEQTAFCPTDPGSVM